MPESPDDIHIADHLDSDVKDKLVKGASVLILARHNIIKGNVKPGFTTIYWDCPWTDGGEVDTLGLLCDPNHPVFHHFPTEFHTNWQWWAPMVNSKPMILNDFPKTFKPTIQMIDDWNRNRKLGVLFEANVGKGKVVVCSIDLNENPDSDPVIRQLRYSLLMYMSGQNFSPSENLTLEQLQTVFSSEN